MSVKLRVNYKYVYAVGYAAIIIAASNTIIYYHHQIIFSSADFDPGVGLGNEAIALIGVVAVVVAQCLKNFDARLMKLESDPNA